MLFGIIVIESDDVVLVVVLESYLIDDRVGLYVFRIWCWVMYGSGGYCGCN